MKPPSTQDTNNQKNGNKPPFSVSSHFPGGFGFGFGGAKTTDVETLHQVSQPGDVVFFGVDIEFNRLFGDHNPGAATFTRENTFCMMPWTQSCAAPCHDIGLVAADSADAAMQGVHIISKHLATIGRRPALVGCDHTASLACASGIADASKEPITYLYLDAHFDLGLHSETPALHNGNFVGRLLKMERIQRVVNVGGRCLSMYVPIYRSVPGFACIPGGVNHSKTGPILDQLSWLKGSPLYVSIDADVLDPSCAPNVCCQEPFGMSAVELFGICAWLGKSCTVLGADLCEILPSSQSLRSEQVLMRCLHALFPKTR
jgi:arginase family enzyme